jgi:DUF4097 and DUF4098 domain-containing protein YvlB
VRSFLSLVSLFIPILAVPLDDTRRLHRTITVPSEPVVIVEATNGSITISGWDRNELDIDLVTRAPTPQGLAAIAAAIEEDQGAVRVSALQESGSRDPRLTSTITIRAPHLTRFQSVHLINGPVKLSRLAGVVHAKSESGDLAAKALTGTLRLETMIGNLSLDEAKLVDGGLIRLRAFHGNIRLRLETTPTDARILATTFNGRISSAIPLNAKEGFGVRFAETTLGRGEPVISIDVVTGDIEIAAPAGRDK